MEQERADKSFKAMTPEDLRRFAASAGKAPEAGIAPLETIRSIKAVGAVVGRDGVLSARDTGILQNTFNLLAQGGFAFAPDVTLDIVNLVNRRDYLREETPADLHVFCYVYSPRAADKWACSGGDPETMKKMERESLQNAWKNCLGIGEAFFHKQSDLHYEGRAWEAAAARQGAKIIATYGYDRTEINTGDFTGGAYAAWIATADGLRRDTPRQAPEADSYGFLIHKSLMAQNAPLLRKARQSLFKSAAPR